MPKGLSMRWMAFAKASPLTRTRSPACSTRPARSGCRSSFMQSNSATSAGTALAAEYGALSADHVEYATAADAEAMAAAGTVAVLLPGAFYTIHETQAPPVQAFRDHGVSMAVGTDWNPGSSPLGSILLAMNMACTCCAGPDSLPRPRQARTRNAARALGLTDRGDIAPGMRADLAVWTVSDPAELSYGIGINPLHTRIFGGVILTQMAAPRHRNTGRAGNLSGARKARRPPRSCGPPCGPRHRPALSPRQPRAIHLSTGSTRALVNSRRSALPPKTPKRFSATSSCRIVVVWVMRWNLLPSA